MTTTRFATMLAGFALASALQAETPVPAQPAASPAPSLSFLDPVESFAQDSILRPKDPFQVVPGKDPDGWSFILEPYLWAMGMSGDVAIKGLPAVHVSYNTKTILQHLDWGLMGKAEVRKGRWGVLGDGFFAQLSANATPPGPLYDGTSLKVQQGMASLALAYRIIDDRRGFLDFYAGARYNYLGLEIDTSTDTAGINQVATQVTDRISTAVSERVQSAVTAAEEKIQAAVAAAKAELRDAAIDRVAGIQSDLVAAQTERLAQLRTELGGRLDGDFEKRFRRDLFDGSIRDRDLLSKEAIAQVAKGATSELRSYVNAAIEARVAAVEARVAAAKGRIDARLEAVKDRAEARAAAAQKKLAKAIANQIEDALPTSFDGSKWWVDPIIGLRAQINFTRWLFLATQGDVGGFGAGSQIAWNVKASVGVNFSRNVFAELGYRYFYMDYQNGGALYNAAEFGIFSGIGVKF